MQENLGHTPFGGRTNHTDPQFAWRVLDQMPSAIIVVDATAQVTYANAAMITLLGRELGDDASVQLLDYVHPEDAVWMAEAFLDVLDDAEADTANTVMPSIHVRVIDGAGETIPLEITGARSITDDVVGGIIYDVRPAPYHDVIGHVLAGLTAGADVAELLSLVAQLIALPPLDLGAVVLASTDGIWQVLSATSPELADAFGSGLRLPIGDIPSEPFRVDLSDLGSTIATKLDDLGYVDIWRVAVADDGYEIIGCARRRKRRSTSMNERLTTARELASVASKQAESEMKLRYAARHDSLTGLANRETFREHLTDAIDGVAEQPAAVLFLDLDRFKPVNDEHGHAAGDKVLQACARRIGAAVRPQDLAARLGGDEFAVLLSSPESVDAAESIAQRIVNSVAAPIVIDADGATTTVTVSVSVGVVNAQVDDDVDRLLGRADRLMYDAKRDAGGSFRSNRGNRGNRSNRGT